MNRLTNLLVTAKSAVGSCKPMMLKAAAASCALAVTAVPVLAVDPVTPLPSLTITQDMLTPLVEGVIANISAILPIGLGLFAVFLGIRIIPSLITRFVH